jgi:hypothetical protein
MRAVWVLRRHWPPKRAIHMWTAPGLQELAACGSKRLRSYVRSERSSTTAAKMGFRDACSKQYRGLMRPLDCTECHAFWDRSITPSARSSKLRPRARGNLPARGSQSAIMSCFLSLSDPSLRLTDGSEKAPRAATVKAGRRPPPEAAHRGLDGASTALHSRVGEMKRRRDVAAAGDHSARR